MRQFFLLIIILYWCGINSSVAQDSLMRLSQILSTSPEATIVSISQAEKFTTTWPYLGLRDDLFESSKTKSAIHQQTAGVVRSLNERIAAEAEDLTISASEDLISLISSYGKLAKQFNVAGGFYNQLLIDRLRRICYLKAALFIYHNPQSATTIEQSFPDSLTIEFDQNYCVALSREKGDSLLKGVELEGLHPYAILEKIRVREGYPLNDLDRLANLNGQSNPDELINNPNIGPLFFRLERTEHFIRSFNIFSYYLRRVGTPPDLSNWDRSAINSIFDDSNATFRSTLLGRELFPGSALSQFLQQIQSPVWIKSFLSKEG